MDYNIPDELQEQIRWVDSIIIASTPNTDIMMLHTYVEWLRRPGTTKGLDKTNRRWYEQLHRGVNGLMSTNELAATLNKAT